MKITDEIADKIVELSLQDKYYKNQDTASAVFEFRQEVLKLLGVSLKPKKDDTPMDGQLGLDDVK